MRLLFFCNGLAWHCTVAVTVLWGPSKHRMGLAEINPMCKRSRINNTLCMVDFDVESEQVKDTIAR